MTLIGGARIKKDHSKPWPIVAASETNRGKIFILWDIKAQKNKKMRTIGDFFYNKKSNPEFYIELWRNYYLIRNRNFPSFRKIYAEKILINILLLYVIYYVKLLYTVNCVTTCYLQVFKI